MPTGYTADVQSGKVTSFQAFAMQCARAFGALIVMRDAPADAPIPETFEPNTRYYDDLIATARAELAELPGLSLDECDRRAAAEHAEQITHWNDRRVQREIEAQRYRAMIAKVQAWTPPTPDHRELRAFMLKQLEQSLRFDCGGDDPAPAQSTGDGWRAHQMARAAHDLAYGTEQRAAEIRRTQERNAWLTALRASLPGDME